MISGSNSLEKNCLWKLRKWRLYWVTRENWRESISWLDVWWEVLDMQLAILEFNFCWLVLSDCNCYFLMQKVPMRIRGVAPLLGNDGKMTWNINISYFFITPQCIVGDSLIQLWMVYFDWLILLSFFYTKSGYGI